MSFWAITRGMITLKADLGHRTGLFAAAAEGPATSEELAARAGLQERYVREWLAALVTAGVFDYHPASCIYTLPLEHAACLAGGGASNLAGLAQINTHLGKHLHQVATAFREGGGVPYSAFRPEFTDVMDATNRKPSTSSSSTPGCRWHRGWSSASGPAPASVTSDGARAMPPSSWPRPSPRRRSSATTWPRTPSPAPAPRRRPRAVPTSGSRWATWPR